VLLEWLQQFTHQVSFWMARVVQKQQHLARKQRETPHPCMQVCARMQRDCDPQVVLGSMVLCWVMCRSRKVPALHGGTCTDTH
jgi:hypothetical protein